MTQSLRHIDLMDEEGNWIEPEAAPGDFGFCVVISSKDLGLKGKLQPTKLLHQPLLSKEEFSSLVDQIKSASIAHSEVRLRMIDFRIVS